MSGPVVVDVQGVSKRFVIRKEKSLKERVVNVGRSRQHREDFWALRDVSLQIPSGSTVGLVGPNGSGKSTLLKTIGGILTPDTGTVRTRGRMAALLELGAGFHPDLTGRENVYLNSSILGLTREQTDRYFDAIVDFSGIEAFIDTQVKFYSSGMYVRLAFAVAVHVDPDVLLVDEVLAVGDEPFQRKCLERIREFQAEGRTIVMVTHSLNQVAEFCDRAVVLEKGHMVADGTARDALRTLRADFEETRQEDRERAYAIREGAEKRLPRVKFTGAALASASGATGRPALATGEALTVAVELEAEDAVEHPVIGVTVATPLGVTLYGTSTKQLGVDVPRLEGTGRFSFELDGLHLAEGEYTVQATVRLPDGTQLHHVPEAASFTVDGPEDTIGPLAGSARFVVR